MNRSARTSRTVFIASRKGFMYLLITSFLLCVILVVFLAANRYKYQDSQTMHQEHIRAVNDFVKSFNQDMDRAAFIAGYRTLIALEDYTAANQTYLNDTETSFRETFYYGTIEGTEVILMNGSSFEDYLLKVNRLSANVGLLVTSNVTQIILNQSNPWAVDIYVINAVVIRDMSTVVSWNYTRTVRAQVSIISLRDPLFGRYTANKIPNTIKQLNTTILVEGTNTSTLQKLINESYYIESAMAPSFLMRFENITGASPYGIETLINIERLSDQDMDVYPLRIKVDYLYFSDTVPANTTTWCAFPDIPATYYLVIDSAHASAYQVNTLNHSTSCS